MKTGLKVNGTKIWRDRPLWNFRAVYYREITILSFKVGSFKEVHFLEVHFPSLPSMDRPFSLVDVHFGLDLGLGSIFIQ